MKALFCNPPWWHRDQSNGSLYVGDRFHPIGPCLRLVKGAQGQIYNGSGETHYPYALASAATFLGKTPGIIVRFRDSICLREDYETFITSVVKENPQLLYLATCARSAKQDLILSKKLLQLLPELRLCLCSSEKLNEIPEELRDPQIDAIVCGYYEEAGVRFFEGTRGLIITDEKSQSLDEYGIPYSDDQTGRMYYSFTPVFPTHALDPKPLPIAFVRSGRETLTGNPGQRFYSSSFIAEWIADRKRRFACRSIHIDNVPNDQKHPDAQGLLRVLSDSKMPWSFVSRAQTCSIDHYRECRDHGCFGVTFLVGSHLKKTLPLAEDEMLAISEELLSIRSLGLTASLVVAGPAIQEPPPSAYTSLIRASSTQPYILL